MATGRPTDYTDDIANQICEHIASGRSLVSWCKTEGNAGYSTVMQWLKAQPAFAENYTRAREHQADYLAEQVVTIADDDSEDEIIDEKGNRRMNAEFAARSKLRVDARKWYAAQMAPKKYGDKLQIDQTTRTADMPDEEIAKRAEAIRAKLAAAQPAEELPDTGDE